MGTPRPRGQLVMLPRLEGPGESGGTLDGQESNHGNFSTPSLGHEVSPLPSLLGYPAERE